MKVATACLQCRQSKRKCRRPAPREPCYPCYQRKLDCGAGGQSQRHSGETQRPQAFERGTDTTSPPALPFDTSQRLVEIYLDKVHDRPHSIFHPATLRARLRNGSLNGALLHAICAIASKFSGSPECGSLEDQFASEAKRLLKADLENVSLDNIKTCILLSTLSAGNCQTSSEALYMRIATSMAEIMHLDSCTLGESSIIARETAQRTWWSLYVADRWCFSGLGLPRHMDHLAASVDLPLDELTFRSLAPEQSSLDTPRKPGLWAYMITLVRLFGPIQDLNRRAANSESETAELDKAVKDLGQQLEGWSENLPLDIQFTVQNLHSYQHNSLGGLFIALHLAYHHYSSLLYFRFLEASQGSSSPRNLYVSRCKHHASSFSGLLQLSRQLNGCEVLYPTVGQMITVSSAVLLHTMLFGESEELPRARRELSANFEALVELQQYWPATTAMINRLMKFQNICLLSTESHKLDGWMVRFLLEHSLALEKRELPFAPSTSSGYLEADSMSSKARDWVELGRYTNFDSL
ncbi:hypothetical protein ASPSYDRAFT_158711 [Aspergillus sydowii CBS 593.65]|uniref:Zn(2)-C6 fungal-type domain-containing protein n=1 Tax=Aspergillus sydowii CBS 593.65 TaxID=1036612 RepID=A0A1L9T6D4_9EURO|nr:uncharacterized protein ASPSYDRAFT_158711 [Aspergillus sydowii CBS 593.65]OJJ55010.1 hypothetical protein ASPSYDRAFT_158711 [Aspergillus sydowii CBS 593.65]